MQGTRRSRPDRRRGKPHSVRSWPQMPFSPRWNSGTGVGTRWARRSVSDRSTYCCRAICFTQHRCSVLLCVSCLIRFAFSLWTDFRYSSIYFDNFWYLEWQDFKLLIRVHLHAFVSTKRFFFAVASLREGGGGRTASDDTIQGWHPNESVHVLGVNLKEQWINDQVERWRGWEWWRRLKW